MFVRTIKDEFVNVADARRIYVHKTKLRTTPFEVVVEFADGERHCIEQIEIGDDVPAYATAERKRYDENLRQAAVLRANEIAAMANARTAHPANGGRR